MRDAIAAMRSYDLIVELKPKKRGDPSKKCNFQLFLKYDPIKAENHPVILSRLFKVGGRWDRKSGVNSQSTYSQAKTSDHIVKLQQILSQLIDWSSQHFPDKLVDYTSDRTQPLASLVSLVEIAIEADALNVSSNLPSILLNLAKFYISQAQCDRAYSLLEECYNLRLTPQETADSLHYLGLIYHQRSDLLLAEQHYQEALALREKILGENHPTTADTTHNLATLYSDIEQYEKAEFWFNQALIRYQNVYGLEHPSIANILNGIGNLYCKIGKYECAGNLYQQVVTLTSKQNAQAYLAAAWHGLGNVYVRQGKYNNAENYYSQSIDAVAKLYGLAHPNIAIHKAALAAVYQIQNKTAEAEELYKEAINLLIFIYGIYHPLVGEYISDLAFLLSKRSDRYQLAQAFFRKAIEIMNKFYPLDHPKIMNIYRMGFTTV